MDEHLAGLFEAHVRYELDRWRDDAAVHATVAEEVAAGFDWLATVTVRTLVPPELARAWLRRIVDEPLTDELFEEFAWAVRAVHESLREETGPLADLVPRERYDDWVAGAAGLHQLRREVLDQVTRSRVYAELIAHVLYHGLKDYLLTENAVVRRLPGASSLVRMGQNAVRSVTPNLEAGIDRRLLAFVADNVAETVRDSRAFLEEVLDDEMLGLIAEEVWATNAPRTVGEAAQVAEDESVDALAAAAWDAWLALRPSPVVTRVIAAVVEQFYRGHGDEPVAVVAAGLGLTPEATTRALGTVATQLVPAAQLEAHIRRRLAGFYSTRSTDDVQASADDVQAG